MFSAHLVIFHSHFTLDRRLKCCRYFAVHNTAFCLLNSSEGKFYESNIVLQRSHIFHQIQFYMKLGCWLRNLYKRERVTDYQHSLPTLQYLTIVQIVLYKKIRAKQHRGTLLLDRQEQNHMGAKSLEQWKIQFLKCKRVC